MMYHLSYQRPTMICCDALLVLTGMNGIGTMLQSGDVQTSLRGWSCLSRKSLRKIYRLQDMLMDEAQDGLTLLKQVVPLGCRKEDSGTCREVWLRLIEASSGVPARVHERDYLKQLRELRSGISEDSKICLHCRSSFLDDIEKRRNEAWESFKEMSLEEEY